MEKRNKQGSYEDIKGPTHPTQAFVEAVAPFKRPAPWRLESVTTFHEFLNKYNTVAYVTAVGVSYIGVPRDPSKHTGRTVVELGSPQRL